MRKLVWSLLSICLLPLKASAFPSNIRYGYTSCASCHVNPTGGGVLTPYGRMSSAEVVSSFGGEQEAGLLWGLVNTSDNLDVGGDLRHISIETENYTRKFVMQREVEVAVNYDRRLYLVASAGLYGEKPKGSEMRRAYLMVNAFDNFTLKAGRFFPAFGIMSEEHYKLYRGRHFNQGRETYNAELAYRNQWMEIIAAKVFGHPDDFHAGMLKGKEGFSGRLSILPTKTLNFGLSYYGLVDPSGLWEHDGAAHLQWAPMKELWFEGQASLKDAYLRIGIGPAKGFMIRPTIEYVYDALEPAKPEINFQWLPRPHFEFQMTVASKSLLILSHYYL